MDKKININHAEAGAMVLQAQMRGMNAEQAHEFFKTAFYAAPAHTATVRRLAKKMFETATHLERMAKEQREKLAALCEKRAQREKSLPQEAQARLEDLRARHSAATGAKRKRLAYKINKLSAL